MADSQGVQGRARGESQGPRIQGRAPGLYIHTYIEPPVSPCSGPVAFPLTLPWTPWQSITYTALTYVGVYIFQAAGQDVGGTSILKAEIEFVSQLEDGTVENTYKRRKL